jgi:hypothetical protein
MKTKINKGLFAVMALLMLFVSCDTSNDVPESSGKLIPVSVRSLEVAADGEETVVRSAPQREAEMVSTPIGDGMLLEMKLEREESPLRLVGDGDTKSLANGAKFRVIALLHDDINNNKYVSHGDFTVTAGPAELHSADPFYVEAGSSYDFICISYNDEDLPATTDYVEGSALPALSVSNSKVNLLWWKSPAVTAISTADDTNLSITLKQKLAKVQVVLDCSYNGWKITGLDAGKSITMRTGVVNGTMNLVTGVVSGTAGDHTITWPEALVAGDEAIRQPSNVFYVIPKSVSVRIPAEAITVTGNTVRSTIPTAVGTGTFSTALEGGGNYKLYVKLRTPKWATSNIYWQAVDDEENSKYPGYLTFDPWQPDGSGDAAPNRGYQGVMFKWGSLVGVAPAQSGGPLYSNNTALYVPHGYPAAPKWKQTTRNMVKDDTDIPAATDNWTTWGQNAYTATDIPYMDPSRGGTSMDRNDTYLIDAARNDETTYKGLRGDICQYLSKTGAAVGGYRLPASYELGSSSGSDDYQEGWSTSTTFAEQAPMDIAGKGSMIGASSDQSFAKNTIMGNVIFPASGSRGGGSGSVGSRGSVGYYWCGSSADSYYARILEFTSTFLDSYNYGFRSCAYSVRCVLN